MDFPGGRSPPYSSHNAGDRAFGEPEAARLIYGNRRNERGQLPIGSGRFFGPKTIEVTVADGDARPSGRKSYYQYGLSHEG